MKAYSIDFRQKILDTYHTEPISQKAIAKRFSVALSFVQKLLKQYRETKNIRPLAKKIYVIIRGFKFNPLELTHNC
ncbi:hypothetical protein QUA16_28000, partial [Microcoleus sp. S13_C3]